MGASSLAAPQTLNLYSYCGNDPINHTDPSGLFWGSLFRAIGKIFNVINTILKWVAVAVVVITVILAIVGSNGAAATFLGYVGGVLGKLTGATAFASKSVEAAAGIGRYIVAGLYSVGAISNFAQTKDKKKKSKKPNKHIVRAVINVTAILSGDNPCSKFFGPSALEALKNLGARLVRWSNKSGIKTLSDKMRV